eukprot:gnl/MRDRNA2_/MRDRNA2_23195_c0_seq1.p1 gnl/MRDRNA2_/MRDRNA2_23195_c0~~gnl/MRDRNA2_/MRDRNA2_23195_c0_seq1.p1  ORF type:complete len:180 (+),score=29.51 gnl/MRDRNA2_/MRDRNA2_23195_c0_seq1:53-541(+)
MVEFEDLQVLKYPTKGHYGCHHDSSADDIEAGSAVRLATVAVFLNDPAQGGELAFPGADKPFKNSDVGHWESLERRCAPTSMCTQLGGVIVKPKKGDAVFWYNTKAEHWRVGETKRIPRSSKKSLYWNSMHCGAEVKMGEKWMANIWLRSSMQRRAREQGEL